MVIHIGLVTAAAIDPLIDTVPGETTIIIGRAGGNDRLIEELAGIGGSAVAIVTFETDAMTLEIETDIVGTTRPTPEEGKAGQMDDRRTIQNRQIRRHSPSRQRRRRRPSGLLNSKHGRRSRLRSAMTGRGM